MFGWKYLSVDRLFVYECPDDRKYLDKLEAKTTIGELLAVKAEAQRLELMDTPEADEVYTYEWAMNSAAVSRLLIGE